jgi:hypothetical protein
MVAATLATALTQTERKKIRVNGEHSLADVARTVCGDARLSALLSDMNPALPVTGLLPAGTVVVCPGKAEAQAFARKMGFSLGFDPRAANGTEKRRRWAAHVGASAQPGRVDIAALARSLLARGVTPAEAGKRIARQCTDAELEALAASADAALREVAVSAEAHALFPRAASRIAAARSLLDATLRPGGLRALLEALARDPGAGLALLEACAVAPALRAALAEEAPRVVALLGKARAIAALERGARDATLARDALGASLRPFVEAFADGVEPLAPERLASAGLEAEGEALSKHVEMLRGALRQAEDGLGRASVEVIRAVATGGDAAALPRPWPLLAAVCRDLTVAMDRMPATARDAGLGGLVARRRPTSAEGAAVPPGRLTVAELQVRAAACARAVDEGQAFAERLAPVVIELFGLMRPPPAVDGGTPQTRRARRRAAFDLAMACARGGVRPEGIAATVADVLERARLAGHAGAQRLSRVQLQALEEAAAGLAGALSVNRHPMSELGRAIVLAAMALDREMGQGLVRPTGREAFVAAALRHAGRVLSAASCQIMG